MNYWTSSYAELSSLYILEFEKRWQNGEKVAVWINDYIKNNGYTIKTILDIPCGIGRISLPISVFGYKVIGIDATKHFMNYALKKSEAYPNSNIKFITSEISNLPDEVIMSNPDLIINWWTSIGYYDKEDDIQFFKNLHKISHLNTILMIETWHRDSILMNPIEKFWNDLDNYVVLVQQEIRPNIDHVFATHTYFEKKKNNDLKFKNLFKSKIILYSVEELMQILDKTGWEVVDLFNTISDKKSFDRTRDRVIIIAKAI